jgi:hypothetical protein
VRGTLARARKVGGRKAGGEGGEGEGGEGEGGGGEAAARRFSRTSSLGEQDTPWHTNAEIAEKSARVLVAQIKLFQRFHAEIALSCFSFAPTPV